MLPPVSLMFGTSVAWIFQKHFTTELAHVFLSQQTLSVLILKDTQTFECRNTKCCQLANTKCIPHIYYGYDDS